MASAMETDESGAFRRNLAKPSAPVHPRAATRAAGYSSGPIEK